MLQLKNPLDVINQIKFVLERGNLNTVKQNTSIDPRYTLHSKCFIPIITELIQFSVILGSYHQQGWTQASQSLVSDDSIVGDIDFCMKKGRLISLE